MQMHFVYKLNGTYTFKWVKLEQLIPNTPMKRMSLVTNN